MDNEVPKWTSSAARKTRALEVAAKSSVRGDEATGRKRVTNDEARFCGCIARQGD